METKLLRKILAVPAFVLAVSGCGHAMKHDEGTYPTPTGVDAPFYITFTAEGRAIVIDRDGNEIKLSSDPVKIPRPATIVDKTDITVLEVRGSHYYILYINGQAVVIPLRH